MSEPSLRIIKKYRNRRLYDTQTSIYITLNDLTTYINENIPFKVIDAKTKADITRLCLIQIILEHEENEGSPIFSQTVLEQMIRFYNNPVKKMFQVYIEQSMSMFTKPKGFF